MGPEIGLEAEGVDGGDEGFDGVEGRAGDRLVGHDVAPPAREHCVHRSHAVGRRNDFTRQVRLHQPRRGHEERRVGHSTR